MAIPTAPTEVSVAFGASREAFGHLLKDAYAHFIADVVIKELKILEGIRMEVGEYKLTGRRMIIPYEDANPEGIGFRAENADLPLSRPSSGDQMAIRARDFYIAFRTTGQVDRASNTNEGAWVKSTTRQLAKLMDQMSIRLQRSFITGSFGVHAEVKTAVAAGTGDLTSGYTVDLHPKSAHTVTAPFRNGSLWLSQGMFVDFTKTAALGGDPLYANHAASTDLEDSSLTAADGVRITAFGGTDAAPTMTVLGKVPAAGGGILANTFVFPANTRTKSPGTTHDNFHSQEGLMTFLYDTLALAAFQGRASRAAFQKATFDSNSGTTRPLTRTMIDRLLNKIRDNAAIKDTAGPTVAWMSRAILNDFVESAFTADQRFPSTVERAGKKTDGFVYDAGEAPVTLRPSRDMPRGCVLLIDPKVFAYYEESPFAWMVVDGKVDRFVSRKDAWERYGHMSGQFAVIDDLRRCGVIEDLSFTE